MNRKRREMLPAFSTSAMGENGRKTLGRRDGAQAEKEARIARYRADVEAGRKIQWISQKKKLALKGQTHEDRG